MPVGCCGWVVDVVVEEFPVADVAGLEAELLFGAAGANASSPPSAVTSAYPPFEGVTTVPRAVDPVPPSEPKKGTSPKVKTPPSEATNQ